MVTLSETLIFLSCVCVGGGVRAHMHAHACTNLYIFASQLIIINNKIQAMQTKPKLDIELVLHQLVHVFNSYGNTPLTLLRQKSAAVNRRNVGLLSIATSYHIGNKKTVYSYC